MEIKNHLWTEKKLILKSVCMLNGANTIASKLAAPHAPLSGYAQNQSSSTNTRLLIQDGDGLAGVHAHTTNQSAALMKCSTTQGHAHVTIDTYQQRLLSQLTRGQKLLQTRSGLASDLQMENSILSDTGTSLQGVAPASNVNTTPHMQSWKDPII